MRKLCAILAADVVGYSRLIRADEARTLERLRSLRSDVIGPILSDHGGRLLKSMGDGWLAAFDTGVDAVTAAMRIQDRTGEPGALAPSFSEAGARVLKNIDRPVVTWLRVPDMAPASIACPARGETFPVLAISPVSTSGTRPDVLDLATSLTCIPISSPPHGSRHGSRRPLCRGPAGSCRCCAAGASGCGWPRYPRTR